ncbi:helix-turn-helix domain-containing protein (plasmid) [Georgenia sp. TF02-10]|uniref:helix-turn-helix domain-containing protein n=1 Tax=Georgenia sp. TF02-10 TaxID=2917725 RepID=UPI001FA6D973|nr:helix-turn-helix domain-containing protein [Georgenia sp. TF02-10]UNX56570.1 helix-turn-helix domain-containing protein [Georgenia sp. TF02-10]
MTDETQPETQPENQPENQPETQPDAHAAAPPDAPAPQVEVRRHVVLSGVVGAVAAVLAVAFALRAFDHGGALDWATFGVLALVTVLHLAALLDGRAPLLVADPLGVRLRKGATWQGIAWDGVECLEHLPRRALRDGHLLVVGDDGRQLIVPLTLATRVVGADRSGLSDELAALADGRADVVEVVPGLAEDEGEAGPEDGVEEMAGPAPSDTSDTSDPAATSGLADETDTVDSIPAVDGDASTDEIEAVDGGAPDPGRPVVAPARVEVHRPEVRRNLDAHTGTHPTVGANALRLDPELRALPEEGADPDHALTVVLDDLAVRPAAEPVIGPQLEAARERLRLTVDQLSERTRIRPHVIEAIEVDDFGPCGGDFYARGHLRTLSRVLGVDAGPLVATYDEKYADAPIDPRRVFESELATGAGGAIRGTRGGRNWSVLVAAIMAAVLVWSVAKLLMDGPVEVSSVDTLNQSAGIANGPKKAAAVPVTLTASGGGARLVVRDGSGDIVLDGPLAFGQTAELEVVPPVRVWSSDGSVEISVDGQDPEPLGETGAEVTKAIPAP